MYRLRPALITTFVTLTCWIANLPAIAQTTARLTVVQAWSRATPPGITIGGAYFTINNSGDADTLLGIESPVCDHADLHLMSMNAGMMQMRPLKSVPVPAHGQVRFEPEHMHVMLNDLHRPLREGEEFPMTLIFQRAGRVSTNVRVIGIGAEAPPR